VRAIFYRLRAAVRHQRWSLLGAGCLCGLVVGLAALPLVGDRRTESAYSRFIAHAGAADVEVDSESHALHRWVRQRPEVEAAAYATGVPILMRRDGGPPEPSFLAVADDPYLTSINRPLLVEGRLPDPDRLEVLITVPWAERHAAHIGENVQFIRVVDDEVLLPPAELMGYLERHPDAARIVNAKIAGVGRPVDDVVQDQQARLSAVVATPALRDALGLDLAGAVGQLQYVRLRSGIDAEGFAASVRDFAARTGEELLAVVTSDDDEDRVSSAIAPLRGILWFAAVISGLLALALVATVVLRTLVRDDVDRTIVGWLGFSRRQILGLAAAQGALMGIVAAAVASLPVLAGSPLFPIGPLRPFDPDPGLRADWPAVAATAGIAFMTVTATTVLAAAVARSDRARGATPSGLTSWLAQGARSGPGLAACRYAFPGHGPLRRAMLAGLVAASIALGVATFALVTMSNGTRLLAEPTRYGWSWDAALIDQEGYGALPFDDVENLLDSAGATSWEWVDFGTVTANGEPLAAIGAERPGSNAVEGFALLEGRLPRTPGEVAVGKNTLHDLGTDVGDEVMLSGRIGSSPATIVGTTVLPAIGRTDAQRPGLGEGMLLTRSGLDQLVGELHGAAVLVNADDTRVDDVRRALVTAPYAFTAVYDPSPTGEVLAWRTMRGFVVGFILVVLAAAVLAGGHGAAVSASRRAPDLATLRALGLRRGERVSVLCREALLRTVVAVVIAVPLGAAVAVATWRWVADTIGVAASAAVEWWGTMLLVGGTLGATGVLAAALAYPVTGHSLSTALRRE
jgi:hypothetical protein